MSKTHLGDVCAHMKIGADSKYVKIGSAFSDDNRISLKIDSLPIPATGWTGWLNVFPRRDAASPASSPSERPYPDEDEIPF